MKSFLNTLFILCTLLNVMKIARAESGGGGITGNGETIVQRADGTYEIADPYFVSNTPPVFEKEPAKLVVANSPEIKKYLASAKRLLQFRNQSLSEIDPSKYKIRLVEKPTCNDLYLTEKKSGQQVACVWVKHKTIDLNAHLFQKLKPLDQAMVVVHELLHEKIYDHEKLTGIVSQLKLLIDLEIEQLNDTWQKLSSAQLSAAKKLTKLTGAMTANTYISKYGGLFVLPKVKNILFEKELQTNRVALSSIVKVSQDLGSQQYGNLLLTFDYLKLSQAQLEKMKQVLGGANIKYNTFINSSVIFEPIKNTNVDYLINAIYDDENIQNFANQILFEECRSNYFKSTYIATLHCSGMLNSIRNSEKFSDLELNGNNNMFSNTSLQLFSSIVINGSDNTITNSKFTDDNALGSKNTISNSEISGLEMKDANTIKNSKLNISLSAFGKIRNNDSYAIDSNNTFQNAIMDVNGFLFDSKSIDFTNNGKINNSVIINSRVPLLTSAKGSFTIKNVAVGSTRTLFHNNTGNNLKLKNLRMVNRCEKYFTPQDFDPIADWMTRRLSEPGIRINMTTCGYHMIFEGETTVYDFDSKTIYMFSKRAAQGTSGLTRTFTNKFVKTDSFSSIEDFETTANDVYRK